MSQRRPLVLTDALIEIGSKATFFEVQRQCRKFVDPDEVWQEICLQLVSRPPQYDPSRGASEATFLKLIVSRAVSKYADKARRDAKHCRLLEPEDREALAVKPQGEPPEDPSRWLQYIDCDETRRFCELLIECKFNKSEVARRLGWGESKVRSRVNLLAPRLLKAGFDPSRFMEIKE
jgi:DNA-directed RNA polymerase specialized sigma24 family protein